MIRRAQQLTGREKESAFLWGARQTGKSTLLKQLFSRSLYYDLLLSEEFERLQRRPSLLREECIAALPDTYPIIIDEIQKIPALLDEVHWLIANQQIPFVLCGSSARKLKRSGTNLLGGRALRYELYPFVYAELKERFDLDRALTQGLLPRHYLVEDSQRLLHAYVGDYLKEEIAAEALTRRLPAFARFLESAAFSNGEIVNLHNIATECGVSAPTVKEYFQILSDTLLAWWVPSFQKRPKRRVIQAPKFYFFDLGVANFLLKRGPVTYRSESFGKAFEHFIFQELKAHSHYAGSNYPISYWRTASQLEVDWILGDAEVAIEVKATDMVAPHHLKGLRAFREEYPVKTCVVVSLDPRQRLLEGITIYPWKEFLEALWSGKILS